MKFGKKKATELENPGLPHSMFSVGEELIFRELVIPRVEAKFRPVFQGRAVATVRSAVEQAKNRFGIPFAGFYTAPGRLGIASLGCREFDGDASMFENGIRETTGFREVVSVTTSRFAYLCLLGIQARRGTTTRACEFSIGGNTLIIVLPDLERRHFEEIEPFIISPLSIFRFATFGEPGPDATRLWGFVIAPHEYLISRHFQA